MKKAVHIIIIGILVLSGLQASAISLNERSVSYEISKTFILSAPIIEDSGEYIKLSLPETTNSLTISGKPELPMFTYLIDIPFGAKNIKIKFTPGEESKIDLDKKIQPSPQIVINNFEKICESMPLTEDTDIYLSNQRYPANWYDSKVTCGIKSNKNRVTYISIYIYPIQYSPQQDKIYCLNKATVDINYDITIKKQSYDEEYDLLIIAPSKFSSCVNKLVKHKNSQNIKTLFKTTESIYDNYSGFDKPEQIKYCIKDMIETHNIEFVLLVGGLKSYFYAKDRDDCNQGSNAWYVPVRYTNIIKSGLHDDGAISDLYYSDIYEEGGNFSSWDSNGDGVYAKISNSPGNDVIDFSPDIYVGRLPCRNKLEVKITLRKIIQYERITPSDNSWFKRMVGISGLSHGFQGDQPDGEYLTDLAFGYMGDIIEEEVRIYSSNEESGESFPNTNEIAKVFTNGARYIFFSGHGHPLRWTTHPVDDINTWLEGIHVRKMWKFFNLKKLPIVVVGGCHNAQFNISFLNTYRAKDEKYDQWYWTHGDVGTHCFCWRMLTIPWGGAIVAIGGTGLTTSLSNNPNTGNSKLATDFFRYIGEENASTVGEAFSKAIGDFINMNPIGLWESHVITIWNMLGDPSLKT